MNLRKLFLTTLLVFGLASAALAQNNNKIAVTEQDYTNTNVEMADGFRADGKIYVVIAVISTILAGISIYLINLDRKITNIEKKIGK